LPTIVLIGTLAAKASWGQAESVRREQLIPILATTIGESANGTVASFIMAFEERPDRSWLQVITIAGYYSQGSDA
jgi:hypothetical protein